MRRIASTVLSAALLAALSVPALAAVIQVPSGQPTIQAAVDNAASGDTIELADGVYSGAGNTAINMAGKDLTLKSASGNPGDCIIDGGGTVAIQIQNSNLHFVSIQGVTIQNGAAAIADGPNPLSRFGGGIFLRGGWLTLTNCILRDNAAAGMPATLTEGGGDARGGAIFAIGDILAPSIVEATNCCFVNNSAAGGTGLGSQPGGAAGGGAIYVDSGSGGAGLVLTGCSFSGNTSTGGVDGFSVQADSLGGAAAAVNGASMNLTDCSLSMNKADRGGAVFTGGSLLGGTIDAFVQCVFVSNEALNGDGGALLLNDTHLEMTNCTVAGNAASGSGGGVRINGPQDLFGPPNSFVRNSIVWGNGTSSFSVSGVGTVDFDHSLVSGSPWGSAGGNDASPGFNLDQDPLFVSDPSTVSLGDVRLLPGSPCVDAGSNAYVFWLLDLDGNGRIKDQGIGGLVDMGAYELYTDPVSLIQDLKTQIDQLVADGKSLPANGHPLKVKLDAAIAALNNGNPAQAISRLQDFINQMNAMVNARKLTAAEAAPIIAQAQSVIGILSGP